MKILVICGLTASGKTSLALKIAKKIGNTCIISVDSRQAYQGLPILTGQDIPPGFIRHQDNSYRYQNLPSIYFSKDSSSDTVLDSGRDCSDVESEQGSINIWGVDQISPTETLNISDFTNFAWQVIKKETLAKKNIIIVGGTGLYLKALTQPMLDIHTGFNQKLRNNLSKLSVKDLQKNLQNLNVKKFKSMNQSDRSNPRRLIRAIEILLNPVSKKPTYLKLQKNTHFRWIGLKSDMATLEKNIHTRVLTRLNNKVINEVKALRSLKLNQKSPIYSALGLAHILKYINKETDKDELIKAWTQADLKYAKRQLTWYKKQFQIIWYDLDSNQKKLINTLSSWLIK
ncbi:hypothetical protein KJ953_03210 [Patescibacteria group bacterium]|nr:hypothetical protein [Patescibacteria group bacterium]